tara:strand:+ start:28 stop:822 length:795 start_codon:yes stop_codon:yes gene_type:complete
MRDWSKDYILPADGHIYVIVPEGNKIQDIGFQNDTPLRIKQAHTMYDVDSFILHFNNHRTPASQIFCNRHSEESTAGTQMVTAIYDYHSKAAGKNKSLPGWCQFTCSLQLKHTPEWRMWHLGSTSDPVTVKPKGLRKFFEDRISMIAVPDADAVHAAIDCIDRRRTAITRTVIDEIDMGAVAALQDFSIEITPYVGGVVDPLHVDVRMSVMFNGNDPEPEQPTFEFRILQEWQILDDAQSDILDTIQTETGVVLYQGSVSQGEQ